MINQSGRESVDRRVGFGAERTVPSLLVEVAIGALPVGTAR
jgi:hypothetical protein